MSPSKVYHIHLEINENIRKNRFKKREQDKNELAVLEKHPIESQSNTLKISADLIVDNSFSSDETVNKIIHFINSKR